MHDRHYPEVMPRIGAFYGIVVTMLDLLDGWLSPRALRLVKEWADMHRDELRENWDRARVHEALEPIYPLP